MVAAERPPSDPEIDHAQTQRERPGTAPSNHQRKVLGVGESLGRYRLLEELGRGGNGVVWKAQDTQLHRVVALKMLLRGDRERPFETERFEAEARAAAVSRSSIHP